MITRQCVQRSMNVLLHCRQHGATRSKTIITIYLDNVSESCTVPIGLGQEYQWDGRMDRCGKHTSLSSGLESVCTELELELELETGEHVNVIWQRDLESGINTVWRMGSLLGKHCWHWIGLYPILALHAENMNSSLYLDDCLFDLSPVDNALSPYSTPWTAHPDEAIGDDSE